MFTCVSQKAINSTYILNFTNGNKVMYLYKYVESTY